MTEKTHSPQDALAAAPDSCRLIGVRRREPNVMPDIAAFLARWDDPAAWRPQARLHVSSAGNVNTVGLTGIQEADDLDPHHPRWREAIEPGVWPLVNILTTGAWRLTTYDSCQGHAYGQDGPEPALRRVGVLPRDGAQQAAAEAALCRAVHEAIPHTPPQVALSLNRCRLTCARSGGHRVVLDLGLDPAARTGGDAYAAAVDEATAVLARSLAAHCPDPGTACGCRPR
ncbi:hypothetical protein [Streptomyces sp. NBC_00859]|uniref:hypothetical protein n=1 Tax=Streptomyces sp. NBC_00859 TaxID=2903682 RepID=UPI0038668163|nr:hypothetical protein OG584_00395 [Streptomyces sp. NBC_00859]WSZ86720.1 hypothetical protein OG584_34745 [Streptomyces sp. NBC_00859]